MKNLITIILLTVSLNSSAQNSEIDILDDDGSEIVNCYYKDFNSLLNQFEGTYLYTNGLDSFKIVLVKKVQQYNGRYYQDLIIGEYQYIKNGVEKVNTLSEINTVYNNQKSHNIYGDFLLENDYISWKCLDCASNEKRLIGSIKDVSTNRYAELIIRKLIVGNQEMLKIKIGQVLGTVRVIGEPAPLPFSLPLGVLTLIKQ